LDAGDPVKRLNGRDRESLELRQDGDYERVLERSQSHRKPHVITSQADSQVCATRQAEIPVEFYGRLDTTAVFS